MFDSGSIEQFTNILLKDFEKCLQCGKCVGICPAARTSSFNSRKIIRDITFGNLEKVVSSRELWTCFFCSACYANCPQDINFPLTVIMLRTASLRAGYGFNYVKKLLRYGWNYYHQGITITNEEVNPAVTEAIAAHSGTDGSITAVRKQMGMPEKRCVSEKALAEIQYLSTHTGMTQTLEELPDRKEQPVTWKYRSERIRLKKSALGKFLGIETHDTRRNRRQHTSARQVLFV